MSLKFWLIIKDGDEEETKAVTWVYCELLDNGGQSTTCK